MSFGSLGVLAQVPSIRYQHCETEAPTTSNVHRMETNYRYTPAASMRSSKEMAYRCEPAWVQSESIFNAIGTCDFYPANCSADANGSCNDTPDDWQEYAFLGATLYSDVFLDESVWTNNKDIKIHSSLQGVAQWTVHRHWGWSDPTRYEFRGVLEKPFATAIGSYPKCHGMAYLVGLFNGMSNTRTDALNGLSVFEDNTFIGSNYQGAPVKYHLFYNPTGCDRSTAACLEDLAEVFVQRSAELDGLFDRRWEYFWEQVSSRSNSTLSFTYLLRSRVLNGAQALGAWFDAMADVVLAKATSLVAQMLAHPPTAAETASHVADLIGFGQQGYRAVLVGHSQGNLFASAAFDGYLAHSRAAGVAAGQDTGYVAANIVHVAPASAVLRGPHVLAEIDLVIKGLRLVDGTPVAPNTLSTDVMPASAIDRSGHGFVETYLDPQRVARGEIKRLIFQSMDAL